MHDARAMRGVERARDLNCDRPRLIDWQRALLEALRQRLAVQKLDDEEVCSVVVADVIERADVGRAL